PYCMTCHRTNDEDWSDYTQFVSLAVKVEGKSFLELYTAGVERRPGLPYMPQAKLLFDALQNDAAAQGAIRRWVAPVGGPACEGGTTCVPSKACFRGVIDRCDGDDLKFSCKPTTPVADGTPCGTESTCLRGVCTPTVSISHPRVPTGIYVRNQNSSGSEAH